MSKVKYRLKESGLLRLVTSASCKSDWTNRDGSKHSSTVEENISPPVEYAVIYRGKGRYVTKYHPQGFTYQWRNPSTYTRGHQVINLTSTSSTLTWSTYWSSGTGVRSGPPSIDLTRRGNWSEFMSSKLDMFPEVSYNELARHNVATRLKIKNATVNLSVFAAESKKAITGLSKNFVDIVKAYRAVRRGRFKDLPQIFKTSNAKTRFDSRDAAGRWLELQYALLPLFGDLVKAYEYIRENIEVLQTYSVSNSFKTSVPYHQLSSGEVTSFAVGSRGVRTRVHYVIDNARLKEAARLGLINPLQVGWELTQFSFVFDWLVPVGNMIEALDATAGTQFISGTQTFWCDVDVTGTCQESYSGFSDLPNSGLSPIDFTSKIYSINRQVLSNYPVVFPYMKNPFSTQHFINAVALLRVIMFKR